MTIPGYKTGDRVRYSAKGLKVFTRTPPGRLGTITNDPERKQTRYLMVHWDGNLRSTADLHPAFIEHELDFSAACAQVYEQFAHTLAYLG